MWITSDSYHSANVVNVVNENWMNDVLGVEQSEKKLCMDADMDYKFTIRKNVSKIWEKINIMLRTIKLFDIYEIEQIRDREEEL